MSSNPRARQTNGAARSMSFVIPLALALAVGCTFLGYRYGVNSSLESEMVSLGADGARTQLQSRLIELTLLFDGQVDKATQHIVGGGMIEANTLLFLANEPKARDAWARLCDQSTKLSRSRAIRFPTTANVDTKKLNELLDQINSQCLK